MRKLELWEVKVKIHGHTVKCGQSQDSSEDTRRLFWHQKLVLKTKLEGREMRLDLLLSHISCCNVCFPIFIFLQCLEGSKEQPVSKHFTICWVRCIWPQKNWAGFYLKLYVLNHISEEKEDDAKMKKKERKITPHNSPT